MAPVLVFTPGWMMNQGVWDRQRVLADRYQLILWNLPSEGPVHSPLKLETCAQALHRLVEANRIEQATYVGWSMGISVFWKYFEMYGAGPFHRLVNIEMVPKLDPRATMVDAVEASMTQDKERAIRKFVTRIFHQKNAEGIEAIIEYALQLPLESVLSVYRDMAESDFRTQAASYEGKQHLAFGRHGFYQDAVESVKALFPDIAIQWFENSAHAPFWEEPEAFNVWLRELTSS